MASTAIVGRDEELASIEAFLARVDDGPVCLVLSGEPGIGKTSLLELVVEKTDARFARTLTCRGVEAEASFAFAGLSELLADVLDEAAPALPPPRRRALEVALVLAEPGDSPPDSHAIGLALVDVLEAVAAHGPLLVCLDDVQWLDPSTVAVVQVAMRRLRGLPVAVLMTVRVAPGSSMPFELERTFPEQRVMRLSLEPLTLAAVRGMLKARLGTELTRTELSRVQEASGGNPLFALELARQGTRLAPGERLRVPDSLGALLGERLARLPEGARAVLLTVAAAGRPTPALVAAAHGADLDVHDALEAAGRDGVIEIGERVGFTHPLLASVCYQEAPLSERRAVHRRLANEIGDVEERARHLALAAAGPDADAASALDEAAEHAAGRGATTAAAELCELAASLTPGTTPASGRRRLYRAASYHRLAGDLEAAVALLDRLLADEPPGVERADVLLELALTRRNDVPTMVALCDRALADADGDDIRASRILAYRSWAHQFGADIRAALRDARAALEKAEGADDSRLLVAAIAQVATAETRAAEITPGLLERGMRIENELELRLEYNESPRAVLARRMIGTGELDRARALLEELEGEAAAWGREEMRGVVLRSLGRVEWLAGRWQRGLEHTTAALEFYEQIQAPHNVALTIYVRALLETDLGRVDDARAAGEEGVAISCALADQEWEIMSAAALGRLDLALGDLEAAGSRMRELPGRLLALGYHDPTVPVWADSIEVLIGIGELDRAREYLDAHECHARRVAAAPTLAAALRCRGLIAGAEGEPETASATLGEALGVLGGLPYPLERGRTLLALGSARRRAKQKAAARDALDAALEIFGGLGAPLWAEKAHGELRRISGRRRAAPDAANADLTETEERVARLAADGRANKEIAAQLFMSTHTVSAHLSSAYRKLGLRSRTELARAMSHGPERGLRR